MLVEYSSNNSGGSFWVITKNWKKLEAQGWKLFNYGSFIYKDGDHVIGKDGLPKRKGNNPGIDTQFGQYAHYAFKIFNSPQEAITEFQEITGLDVSDEGCNCCGAPHSFSWDGGYCSGEGCLEYIYPDMNTKKSKRELLEDLRRVK